MIKYGFELEGFAVTIPKNLVEVFPKDKVVIIPPKDWPVDGFPGLVEIRTSGGGNLEDQLGALVASMLRLKPMAFTWVDIEMTEYKFSAEEMSYMRKNRHFDKRQIDVRNIYGKAPRRLGNRTLASFQINISNLKSEARITRSVVDGKIKEEHISAIPYPFDTAFIISRLDKEFAEEIKASSRQPGMYAIKDGCRLEYRSLPNSVFSISNLENLAKRIRIAVEGEPNVE